MKWLVVALCIFGIIGAVYLRKNPTVLPIISPIGMVDRIEKPLNAYGIERLGEKVVDASDFILGDITETADTYTVRSFSFKSNGKTVSGIAHIPNSSDALKRFPVIIQFRGYVDPTIYTPGLGTQRSAEVFARNGFLSLAPDFLGYASSDPLSNNIFLDRFETYTTALTLISSVSRFPGADSSRIGIWGHSNGGQITLTVLEILQKPIPTSVWAPVTKPFPYSILYYTDDAPDHGKFLRKELAAFESLYDVEQFSLSNYIQRLTGPIQLHQGGADDAVPIVWNDSFVAKLKDSQVDIQYYTYPTADHNMVPAWDTVVRRDIEFFNKYLP